VSYNFYDCFGSCDERSNACNWKVLSNSDLSHKHRSWESGKYVISAPGNRHLPNTPSLSEFTLETTFTFNDSVFENLTAAHPTLRIFFYYDERKRTGYFVDCRVEDSQCIAVLGHECNGTAKVLEQQNAALDAKPSGLLNAKLKVANGQVELSFDSATFAFKIPEGGLKKGRIGFDRSQFMGVLELREVKISSPEKIVGKEILPETEIIFPASLNGFHTPLKYKVSITGLGGTARLDLELSGSDTENPDVPWFPYHGLMIDMLTAPYVRLGVLRLYPVGRDTLTLANPSPINQKFFYKDLYRKPEWPLRASFFLADIPEVNIIAIGYEHCVINIASHLRSGPNEAIFDIAQKKIVYAGTAPQVGEFALELHSQPDKEICRRIPETDPRYEAALAFARRNHFFIELEQCSFKAVIRFGGDEFLPEDVSLNCQLENAFTEELETLAVSPFKVVKNAELNFTEFIAELPPKTLPPGVYHLSFDLWFAGSCVITQRHAFEVMSADPDAPSAPLLSGLPLLFSMPNETKGLEQDQFEPYLNVENNVAHYLSVTTHAPDVGRRHRIYDILKTYHRKWWVWIADRVCEHPDIESNRDVVSKCDFIFPCHITGGEHHDMWKPATYSGPVLALLIEFLRSNDFSPDGEKYLTIAGMERLRTENGHMPEAALEELVTLHWRKWLDFFNAWFFRENLALQKHLREINPGIKRSAYGPMNVYVAHGKTNHVLKYQGTIPEFCDGFFAFEDYPFSCKYNIQRGPILLTALKMAAPDTKIYPEVYPCIIQGCPDGAVGYAWPPFGNTDHPASADKKRYFEYAYATAWFDKGQFNYWQDYGFHTDALDRERFDVILDSWKFIHKAKPAKPMRCTAYAYSDSICENHQAFYEYSRPNGYPWGDIFNTAEETIPYVQETARVDGQQSGFLCALESLRELSAKDVGLLVLPPLCGVTAEQIDAIRKLHAQGVNLLAFETVDGLEDLFGVELMEKPVAVKNIKMNAKQPDNPLLILGGMAEYTEHPLCIAKYRATSASVLLEAEAPVLFCNQTASGKTALFNIPPTVVRRDSFYERVAYGRSSISELMNKSVALIHRELNSPATTTTAGKLIAFEAQNGDRHIIIMEDAFPEMPVPISPLVTIHLPDLKADMISCDKPFTIKVEAKAAHLRLSLAEHECAIVTIKNANAKT